MELNQRQNLTKSRNKNNVFDKVLYLCAEQEWKQNFKHVRFQVCQDETKISFKTKNVLHFL